MTDVLISYAREDRERARKLAGALEARGWSVWWDRKIVVGQAFDQAIEHELETAKCVVVLWSEHSIVSEWVKNEAAAAAERGVLVPALIDDIKPPLEFRRKQTADLVDWDGNPSHEGFQSLCDGVATKANITGVTQGQPSTSPQRGFRLHRRWILGATAIAIAGLIIVLIQSGVFERSTNQRQSDHPEQNERSSLSPSVFELESQLKAVNIELSTGTSDDTARVRGYFTGPTSPYHLLAVNCLQVLGNRRLRETGYLDMIDKWYTSLQGSEHYVVGDNRLDHEKLKEAIVKANNDYYGRNATSFEQVVQ